MWSKSENGTSDKFCIWYPQIASMVLKNVLASSDKGKSVAKCIGKLFRVKIKTPCQ